MSQPASKPKRRFRWIRIGTALFGIAAIVAFFAFVRSNAFREQVRREVIARLEDATGGKVELKQLAWSFSRLEFDIEDLTIQGLEKPGELPYLHVDHAHVAVKIISFLRREIALQQLTAEHPVAHLIVYPDGTTNQPAPKAGKSSAKSSRAEPLFALRLDRLKVTGGVLLINDKRFTLDLNASDIAAGMSYSSRPEPNYLGHIQASRVELNSGRPTSNRTTEVISKAETNFTIHKNQIEISALRWSSGYSSLDASGSITNLNNPRVEAKYKAKIALAAVGSLFAQPELRDGTVELIGTARYLSTEDFFSSGKLLLRNGAYADPGLRLSGINANSEYTVDVDRITATKLTGNGLGGTFKGSVSLLHWANIAPTSGINAGRRKQVAAKPQEGTIQLDISGIELAGGLRAILPQKNPLNHLRIVSAAQGKLGIHWTGSPLLADTTVDLETQAPEQITAAELPLTGSIHATHHGRDDRIDVAGVSLAARSTRISATGALGTRAQLRVSLNTSDLSELTPVMRALGSSEGPLPAILHGQASFNGTLTGKLNSPTLIGHLQATDFETEIPSGLVHVGGPGPTKVNEPVAPSHTLHWDSLAADITYSPTSATAQNVILKRGKAQITGSEQAGLIDGSLEPESPVRIQIAATNTELADLQQLARTNYPITGTLTGRMTLTGTKANLNAAGHVQVAGGTIYGEPYRSFSTDLRIQGQDTSLQNIVLQEDGGRVSGAGTYNFESEAFNFNLSGSNFDLAHMAQLQGKRFNVGGNAEFSAAGSGTVSQPQISARFMVKSLVFSGEAAGDLMASAVTRGQQLHVEAHTSTPTASANLSGDVELHGDLPTEAHLELARLDFDPLLRVYLPGQLTGHSSVSGKFTLRGPLKRPKDIVITADVDQFSVDIQNLKLYNQGPLQFTVTNQIATIQQLHILGPDTDITGIGKVDLAGAGRMDLHGNGHVNLSVLRSFNHDITSTGQMTFTVNATGKLDDPSLVGNVQIANGTIVLSGLPNGLSEINGTLNFDRNRLRVQKLTAKSGGGDLVLGGYITYSNGIFFDLNTTGRDIRMRYPEGVSSQGTADLRLVGTAQNSVLSGDVTITKFGLTPQFDLAAYVQRAKQPPTPPSPNSLIDNVRLDVHIVSTPELRLETSMARLSGDVDIRLRGTAARPSILGRVSIAEGDITFNSTTYHLERGDIVFSNPVRIEPVVNVEASARVRDYDITLGFHGTPEKLNVTYRSEPPLPSADIIALLAFGRTRQESEIQAEQGSQAATQQSFAQTASNAILGEALNSAVSSRVQKLFGISRIKIDPNLGGTEDNPNARLTVEQQISKNVTVTYLTNLGQYAEEVLQVEYNINRNISLVAVRDYTGVLAIDFRVRQRKR